MLVLVVGWVLYFFVHSVMATDAVKGFFKRILGRAFRIYRIVYALIAGVGLLIMLVINASLQSDALLTCTDALRYLSFTLAGFGVIVIRMAFKQYNFASFIGFKNETDHPLITSGILNFIRHPIYSGTILIVVGFWFFSPNVATLVSALCILAYLPVGIYLEEKKLIKHYGDEYRVYRKRVPALIPKLF